MAVSKRYIGDAVYADVKGGMIVLTAEDGIGDAVYADVKGGMIVLTTEDGIAATNTIYLEVEVWHTLVRFVSDVFADAKAAAL